jgi:hypothetical protein
MHSACCHAARNALRSISLPGYSGLIKGKGLVLFKTISNINLTFRGHVTRLSVLKITYILLI